MELTVRALTEMDEDIVKDIDNISGSNVLNFLDCDEYSWGIFKDKKLIGYCTLGYADIFEEIKTYQGYKDDSILLSDVFVLPHFRGQGVATNLINNAIKKHSETQNNLIFLTLLESGLQYFYRKLNFKCINDYVMVKQCM